MSAQVEESRNAWINASMECAREKGKLSEALNKRDFPIDTEKLCHAVALHIKQRVEKETATFQAALTALDEEIARLKAELDLNARLKMVGEIEQSMSNSPDDPLLHEREPTWAKTVAKQTIEIEKLIAQVELLHMQAAGAMTATSQNTEKSIKARIGRDNPYWSQLYGDVCTAVDREMRERARATAAEAALVKANARLGWLLENVSVDELQRIMPNLSGKTVGDSIDAQIAAAPAMRAALVQAQMQLVVLREIFVPRLTNERIPTDCAIDRIAALLHPPARAERQPQPEDKP